MNQKFILNAVFSSHKFEDSVVTGIVGRPSSASGFLVKTSERDMQFEFTDEGSAKKALARLKKKGIKAVVEAQD